MPAARSPAFRVTPLALASLIFCFQVGRLSAQSPASPGDLLKEAESAQKAGNFDEAIQDYRLVLAQYPDIFEVRSNLGAALAGAGQYEEAIAEYERALKLRPDPRVRLNLALAYYKANQLGPAVRELETVRSEMSGDLRVEMLLADCYLRQGENKKVIELLQPVEASHSDNLAVAYLLGSALVRDRQVDEGQAIIDKILKNGDSAEARLLMGTTKLMAHDDAGALTDLQKAVELNSGLPSAHAFYGRALMESGNQEGAEKAFRKELSINPNDFDSNLYLAVILKESRQYDEALGLLQHALEVRPGDMGVRFQIASLHLAQRKYDDAQKELESLVKEAPNFREAHVALATLYYRLKRKEDGDREQRIVERLQAEEQARTSAEQGSGHVGRPKTQ
jgi:tetratricopeptide (TPR) repeat protein